MPLIKTDEGKVYEIISNLLDNALKYSPTESHRVNVRGVRHSDGVLVSVTDEGRGIPAELHDKVFERFYQVDQSSTRAVGGTGLGLYICRKMTEVIGGRLWLERSDTMGSVFCLGSPPLLRSGAGAQPASLQRELEQRKAPRSDALKDVTSQRGANPDA